MRDLGPAFLLGVLAAAGQAPLGLWPLALAGYAGIVRHVATRPEGAALRAWAAGLGHFGAALSWIVQPFLVDPETYGWMAPFALLAMAGGLALFWAVAGWIAAQVTRPAFGFALALAALEALRGVVLTGFPWALPGHIWIDLPVAQAAAWIGANGLTLLTLLMAALPVVLRLKGLILAALLLAGLWGGGLWRLSWPEPPAPGLVFRLVQPDAEQHRKRDPD
ncbi:MAG: apolipoprotein N-acyltransferase, partial [Gemmobacter sp.]|nr:apolipoprotein N-acyltransferase [Gemmobacter sp.]